MVELVYNVFHIGFKKEKNEIRTESANLFLRFMFILDNLHFLVILNMLFHCFHSSSVLECVPSI